MKAIIDIKTPAGKSFEGFPKTMDYEEDDSLGDLFRDIYAIHSPYVITSSTKDYKLHPGDTITITIQKDI